MLRLKVLLLAILPLVFAVGAITFIVLYHSDELIDEQLTAIETNVIEAKKEELENYMSMALAAVNHVYDKASVDDNRAKEQVKAILHDLRYGTDGYFFVYDQNGIGIVHPTQPKIVGQNWWGLQDSQGRLVIKELTERARNGGGFYRYLWEKPPSMVVADKLGYAVMLKKWNWMIGTGVYLDQINQSIAARKLEIKNRIQRTFVYMFWITLIALAVVFLTGVVINLSERKLADRKLKHLTQRIVEFQEEERARVSRELHDGISQILVSVKYSIELAIDRVLNNKEDAITPLNKGAKGLLEAIGEVRRISRDLRPSVLDDLGLSAALESMSRDFSERTGIKVEFTPHVFTKQLNAEVKTTLFRVAQECFTNIERHSGAARVVVELTKKFDGVRMIIADDGVGLEVQRINDRKNGFQGIGFKNMQERLEFHNGELNVWSSPDSGTVIEARLPHAVLKEG